MSTLGWKKFERLLFNQLDSLLQKHIRVKNDSNKVLLLHADYFALLEVGHIGAPKRGAMHQ